MTRHRIEKPRHKRNYHDCLDRLSLIVLFYRLTYHSRAALGLRLCPRWDPLLWKSCRFMQCYSLVWIEWSAAMLLAAPPLEKYRLEDQWKAMSESSFHLLFEDF